MGICLDTDASTAQDAPETGNDWKNSGNSAGARRARSSNLSVMQNAGKIKFDPPKVPVIFILGGPGSGKVTHCDTFMHEKRGVTHINMMDLLQQYAMGNDMQDFSQLSSKTVTEVLMLEMKMAPAAKAYLISGYPRSMRDVVEYSEKIQVVNGVILISWRQSVLQKQIDYGAKLGHVVLSLAKMELDNFFKNVMPVADYFDQSDMLLAVNGERTPSEVYKDFRTAVLDILGALENQEAILNGVTGMGRGMNDIPGSIVSVETAPSQPKNITELAAGDTDGSGAGDSGVGGSRTDTFSLPSDPTSLMGQNYTNPVRNTISSGYYSNNSLPPVIWIIGGPGSNKANLCLKVIGLNPGWGHISIGRILRSITDSAPRANTESYAVKEALAAGEMAPEKSVDSLLDSQLQQLKDKTGILIDGFPRNLQQVKYFENKYKQKPPVILLDCSKLQLGRGRIDDTVSSFRRRLELFRELTLPMLKTLDTNKRLIIVDGDTDSPSVQREFEKLIKSHILTLTSDNKKSSNAIQYNNHNTTTVRGISAQTDTMLHDLEDNVPGIVPTISHHVSLVNGHLKTSNHNNHNNYNHKNRSELMNGNVPNHQLDFRHMLDEVEKNPLDSYM